MPVGAEGVPTEQPVPETEKSPATRPVRFSVLERAKFRTDELLGEVGEDSATVGAPRSTSSWVEEDLEAGPV